MKHLFLHKYKWTTYHTQPVFVSGLFQDWTERRLFQQGDCKCGAYKYREIDVNPELEADIAFSKWQIEQAKKAEQAGNIDLAIEILKI